MASTNIEMAKRLADMVTTRRITLPNALWIAESTYHANEETNEDEEGEIIPDPTTNPSAYKCTLVLSPWTDKNQTLVTLYLTTTTNKGREVYFSYSGLVKDQDIEEMESLIRIVPRTEGHNPKSLLFRPSNQDDTTYLVDLAELSGVQEVTRAVNGRRTLTGNPTLHLSAQPGPTASVLPRVDWKLSVIGTGFANIDEGTIDRTLDVEVKELKIKYKEDLARIGEKKSSLMRSIGFEKYP